MTSDIPIHCARDRLADVTAIIANPRNPNRHGDKQIALLAKIIKHQGWRAPIVVSKRSGFIVAGHGRLQAALLLGCQSVPVNDQDFATEADEWAHLVADNRIAELAEMDGAELKIILTDLESNGYDLDVTGFDAEAVGEITAQRDTPEADAVTLAERFGVPPFSVLDARQGYWQDRKREWLSLGIKSELGRGGGTWREPQTGSPIDRKRAYDEG